MWKPSKKGTIAAPSVTSTRAAPLSGDAQSRPSEEDLLLFHSLRLLDGTDALQSWPELSSCRFELAQSMFAAPNRTATEALLYFLFARLTDREATKKEFRDVWPTATAAQAREFRSRAIELIRRHAEQWEISTESVTLLPALLQRHAGQKLVRLFCELSYAAMKSSLCSLDPDSEHESSSANDSQMEGSLSDRLLPAKIRVGQAKIAALQKRFLTSVVEGKRFREELRNTATGLISRHVELATKQESLQQELTALGIQPNNATAQESETFDPLWTEVESITDHIEELGQLTTEILRDGHSHAISGEGLLTLMTRHFEEAHVRQSIDGDHRSESNPFETESAVSVSVHGKTEVDVLSMARFWARNGVANLVDAAQPMARVPRQAFIRELMDDESVPALFRQTAELHTKTLEELREAKTRLVHEIQQLDGSLDSEERRAAQLTSELTTPLPSLLSILKE